MIEREEIERQIRALLTANVDSITFSNKLFHQGIGLFPRLGKTFEDRRSVLQLDLFRAAQMRLRELERQELERFNGVATQSPAVPS